MFFTFFKLYKWYQIAQHITNYWCNTGPLHLIPLFNKQRRNIKVVIRAETVEKWGRSPKKVTLNIFQTFFYCLYCWNWTGKCLLGGGKYQFKVNNKDIIITPTDTVLVSSWLTWDSFLSWGDNYVKWDLSRDSLMHTCIQDLVKHLRWSVLRN